MSDLISREAAIDTAMNDRLIINAMDSVKDGDMHRTKRAIVRLLASLPAAEKVGKWIEVERGIHTTKYRCSVCGRVVWDDTGYDVVADYPYCNCGARMEGEEDEGG